MPVSYTHLDVYKRQDGVEYFFVDETYLHKCRENGTLIECRTYDTVYGPWNYFTVDDGQIDLGHGCYLVMGTLESYEKMRLFYGTDALVPLYIHVEDGLRLRRALEREEQQKVPKYKEMCRRFLADEEDFKQENLDRCGIVKWYEMCIRDKAELDREGGQGMKALTDLIFTSDFFYSILRVTTPLLFASMGAVVSDVAGVPNIALEGMMLMAAFAGMFFSYLFGSAWAGLAFAILTAVIAASVLAFFTLYYKTNIIQMCIRDRCTSGRLVKAKNNMGVGSHTGWAAAGS